MIERICWACKFSSTIPGGMVCMAQKNMPLIHSRGICENWKSIQPSRADRIRAMADEELANFIHDQIIDRNIGISTETWLDWLREEAEP